MMTPAVQEARRHNCGCAPRIPTNATSENTPLGPDEIAFVGERDSFYIATVRVRDPQTLATGRSKS
jgi:hypothetical protein